MAQSKLGGPYDELSVDTDGDGSLTDKTCVRAYPTATSRSDFEPVQIAVPHDGDVRRYEAVFARGSRNGEVRLYVRPGGWYERSITIGGKLGYCAVVDKNANGAFNDASINSEDCGLIQLQESYSDDVSLMGRFIQVDDARHGLSVAPDGSHVVLDPVVDDSNFGTLALPASLSELILGGENGMLTLDSKKGDASVPEGTYRVYQRAIEREDARGDRWKLVASSNGNREIFEVVRGAETRQPFPSKPPLYRNCASARSGKGILWILRGTVARASRFN